MENPVLRIERFADQGRCVAHLDGRVVFVRFALPGELVEVTMDLPMRPSERFWTGEVSRVIEASPLRTEPVWPLAGPLAWGGGSGGADLIHVSLPGQIEWKSTTIAEQMRRMGHVDVDVPVARMEGDEALQGLHWRTRIEMVTDDQGQPAMRRRESHDKIPIDTMPLATEALLQVANDLGIFTEGAPANAHLRLAVPEPRGEREVGDNYAYMVNGKVEAGNRHVIERTTVDDHEFTYRVDAGGFWQMHRYAPLALPQYVMNQVHQHIQGKTHPVLWDLYSGSGLFTLPLAALSGEHARVLSIEGAPIAVKNARHNLKTAGLHNVVALEGDVAKTLAHVDPEFAHPDVVVLDPPRAGAKAQVCKQIIASKAPCVIYIACNPTSLARDTATLCEGGYTLRNIQAFDIYPNTHHVETVAVFIR